LDIAAPKGRRIAYHQYHPLTKRGNNAIGSGFNDDPLWLIYGTGGIREGDGGFLHPKERWRTTTNLEKAKPLSDHLVVRSTM
jgi:cellobiose phosphorylase